MPKRVAQRVRTKRSGQSAEPRIPASLELEHLEAQVRRQIRSFCQSATVARRDVAVDYGFRDWKELTNHFKTRPRFSPPEGSGGRPVSFEVCFPRERAYHALRDAGLYAEAFAELTSELLRTAERPLQVPDRPAEVACPYLHSEYPVSVNVRVLEYGLPTVLRISTSDQLHGERLRKRLTALAAKEVRGVELERRHSEVWAQIEKTLQRSGVSLKDVRAGRARLSRAALKAIIRLSGKVPESGRKNLHGLCGFVGPEDREVAARWLISEFERPQADDQLALRISEVATPAVASELIRLIRDSRSGEKRGVLCLALAETRHPQAAEVIASVLKQRGATRCAIEALGRLKAVSHRAVVQECLQHRDADVRGEAKTALQRIGPGYAREKSPLRVLASQKVPRGLAEWSANLDRSEVRGFLSKLSRHARGFGREEISGIVEDIASMAENETRVFRIPGSKAAGDADVWIAIFMDDSDSPDVTVSGKPTLIAALEEREDDV